MKLTLKRSQERLAALELQKRDIDDAILQLKHDVRIIDEFLKVKERSREAPSRSEEHTFELQSLMRISYAVFCLKKKKNNILLHLIYINESRIIIQNTTY